MSWITSDRASRLPEDWVERQAAVLRRDKNRCKIVWDERCEVEAHEVDHIVPGDDHDPKNLRAACGYCHGKKSSREGHQAKKRLKQLRKRPADRHPGSID